MRFYAFCARVYFFLDDFLKHKEFHATFFRYFILNKGLLPREVLFDIELPTFAK